VLYGVVVRFPVERKEVGHLPSLPEKCPVFTPLGHGPARWEKKSEAFPEHSPRSST
jgi:hypothetical protein